MFVMLELLAKVVVGAVKVPAAAIADAITMGGALADKQEPYTVEALKEIMDNLDDASKPR